MLKHNAAQAEYVRLAALGWFAGPQIPRIVVYATAEKGSTRHAKGLCHVGPVGFGVIQPPQLVSDLAQQVFPPRNVGVGFDTQRRGAIHHAEHAAAQLRLRCRMHGGAHCQGRQAVSEMATTCTGCIRQKRWLSGKSLGLATVDPKAWGASKV